MDACFSGGAIASITGLLGAVWALALWAMRELIRSKDSEIETLRSNASSYHAGWVETLKSTQTVASVAARTIDIAERQREPS